MSYEQNEHGYVKVGKETYQLTNFKPKIKTQTTYHDGSKTRTVLTMEGTLNGKKLPDIEVPAKEFASMSWVSELWGMTCIIYPTPSSERELKTAIQIFSEPKTVDVYTHTGWTKINGKDTYLSNAGGITAKGLNPKIKVSLPQELINYRVEGANPDALNAALLLGSIAETGIGWIVLLAAFRAAIGAADFAIHVAGRTGTFKSEMVSLFQSLFGAKMDARHLPGSWSSTANALEQQAYLAANALFVIDDYVPYGTAWQVRQLNKTADQLIRAQGNQQGRARMTETAALQMTYYPRGIILSTGEDIPEGHSLRGRTMLLELAPGDITAAKLSAAQKRRDMYPAAMAAWIQHIATVGQESFLEEHKRQSAIIRDQYLDIGHARTPQILGDLIATAEQLAMLFDKSMQKTIVTTAREAVIRFGEMQNSYLEHSDPVLAFVETMQQMMGSHTAHIRTRPGGIPKNAESLGWSKEESGGDIPSYKAHGIKLGWIDWRENECYIDPNCINAIKKHSGGRLAMSNATLSKRLKEAMLLERTDEARQRNTCRVTCENASRQVLVFSCDTIIPKDDRIITNKQAALIDDEVNEEGDSL